MKRPLATPHFHLAAKALLMFALSSELLFSGSCVLARELPTAQSASLPDVGGARKPLLQRAFFLSEESASRRRGQRASLKNPEKNASFAGASSSSPRRLLAEVCTTEPVRVWSTCSRVVETQEAGPCMQQEAQSLKGLSVGKQEQPVCRRRSCTLVPVERMKVCTKRRKVQIQVPCKTTKKERVCRKVSKEKPATCYREEFVQEEYKCTKDEIKKQCRMAEVDVEAVCEQTELKEETYVCEKLEKQKQCRQVQVPVTSLCKEVELKRYKYKCTKTEWKVVCKKHKHKEDGTICEPVASHPRESLDSVVIDHSHQKAMTETAHSSFASPLAQDAFASDSDDEWEEEEAEEKEFSEDETDITGEEAWQDQDWNTVHGLISNNEAIEASASCAPSDPWCQDRRLGKKKKKKKKDFYEEENVCSEEHGNCQSSPPTVIVQSVPRVCKRVAKKVHAVCEGEKPVEHSKKCVKLETQEKCDFLEVPVASECTRSVPVSVSVPCFKKEKQKQCRMAPVKVHATCTREVPRQVPYKCMQPKEVTVCKTQVVPAQETCYEDSWTEQTETCATTHLEQQCIFENESCPVLSTGGKHKHKHGKKHRKKRYLHAKAKTAPAPCVRTVPMTQSFPCQQTKFITNCGPSIQYSSSSSVAKESNVEEREEMLDALDATSFIEQKTVLAQTR